MKTRLDETNKMRRLMGLPLLSEQYQYNSPYNPSGLLNYQSPTNKTTNDISDPYLDKLKPPPSDTFTPEKYNNQRNGIPKINLSSEDTKKLDELNKESGWNLSIDNIVDIVSAIIDGIPGVGNLVSFIIDILHSISYFIRGEMGDTLSKIENYVSGIITAGFAFIPTPAGNMTSIFAKGGVKRLLSHTPEQIYEIAIKLGIAKAKIFLNKDIWKYCLLLLLVRLFREDLENNLTNFISKVGKGVDSVIKSIKEYGGLELPNVSDIVIPGKYVTKEIGKLLFSDEIIQGLMYIKNGVIPFIEELLYMTEEIGYEKLEELSNELM